MCLTYEARSFGSDSKGKRILAKASKLFPIPSDKAYNSGERLRLLGKNQS